VAASALGEWFLNPTKGGLFWSPGDRRLALLFDAWQTRNRSNAFQYPQIAMLAWRKATSQHRRELNLPSTVTSVERRRGWSLHIAVGRPAIPREAPPYLLMRQCLEGSYLAGFLDRALPKRPELNCDMLGRGSVLSGSPPEKRLSAA